MTYILGILGIAVGIFLVIKTEWFIANFGTSGWAEQHLGTEGGTRLMYKSIGLIAILLSLLGMTGMLGPLVISIFGGLFGLKNQ